MFLDEMNKMHDASPPIHDNTIRQGFEVRVKYVVGVGGSRQFWPETESQSMILYRLRPRPQSQTIVFRNVKFLRSKGKMTSRRPKVVSQ